MGESAEMEQREGSKGRGAKGGEQREEKTGRFNINQFHFTLGTR